MKQHCELRVGRLIAHPCGRKVLYQCGRCQASACRVHFDPELVLCGFCAGTVEPSTAPIDLEELGDPLEFSPEIHAALAERPGRPADELTGVDS